MDIAHPGHAIAPTLDVIVLEVLARTKAPMPLAQIHRLAGTGSVSGHLKALTRLVDSGVVLSQPGGYVLNREHVAAPAVEALAAIRSELLDRIRNQAGTWRPVPVLVGVFGSFARRMGDANSDIDVLVVRHAAEEHAADQAGELAAAILRWSGNDAHVVDVTIDDLTRMAAADEPILGSWRADLVPLIGRFPVLMTGVGSPADRHPEASTERGVES
jgi:predicted nucleotidyltransferase